MGELKNSTPGYHGNLSPNSTNSEAWSYFLVEPRYGVSTNSMEASHILQSEEIIPLSSIILKIIQWIYLSSTLK